MSFRLTPIFDEVAWSHGFAPRDLQETAMTDECFRCEQEPAGRIDPLEPERGLCRACLDEVSHAAETRRFEDAWAELTNDGTDGGRWIA